MTVNGIHHASFPADTPELGRILPTHLWDSSPKIVCTGPTYAILGISYQGHRWPSGWQTSLADIAIVVIHYDWKSRNEGVALMPSQFGWVDFAETDRQRMLNVIQLFREQDTRDELGIGTIRDAFADYFFPGTSTIQTRVRYMLFIPWIYQELEKKQVGSDRIAKRARNIEIKLIDALLASEGKNWGVIGQDAKARLKRLPSSVYWSGLGAWGIRLFPDSQDQYHRYLNVYYAHRQRRPSREETDSELASGLISENWDPGLPTPPEDYPQKCSFSLTPDEARYFQERIYLYHPDSLLQPNIEMRYWESVLNYT